MPETNESADVIELWNNIPGSARGVAIAGIILYILTFSAALAMGSQFPYYVTVGLFVWPLIIVAWLLVVWLGFTVFSVAAILTKSDKEQYRKMIATKIVKTIIFIPAVIGTALTVVEAFANDIFSGQE